MKKLILSVLITTSLAFSAPAHAENSEKDLLELLDLFGDVLEKVRKEYVEAPSDEELIGAAINGMLTDLDPHSSYLDKKAFSDMRVQTKGEFGGLGIEVTMRNGMVYVVSPIDDTPAFKAGMKAGDYISHIDGESVLGLDIGEAVKKMRGKKGTDIALTVIRESEDEPLEIKITRDIIKIKSVRSRVEGEDKDVVYLRITSFSEQTAKGLKKQFKERKEEVGDKIKGVVLDLRNNPGGLLNQAIAVSDMFLDKGEIVSTRGRDEKDTKRFNASHGDLAKGYPVVVLINGGSASASEIVAGALQDHRRAMVVGTKSFGKGSVQTVIPLPRESAIRLTTSRYYTPSGKSIQAKGIDPDIIIDPAKIEFVANKRKTSEASLRGHLENNDKDGKKKKEIKHPDAEEEEESLYLKDYQLARAIDLLRALSIYTNNASVEDKIRHALME